MKNYNIILFKSKFSTDAENWDDMVKKDLQNEHKEYLKAVKRLIKKLEGVDSDAYVDEYSTGIRKLFEYSSLPVKHFAALKVQKMSDNKLTFDVLDLDELKPVLEEVADKLPLKDVCVFTKQSFVYNFFKEYLADNACWLTEDIIDKGIALCDSTIKDKKNPAQYLPSEEENYDKEYFTNVREFRKALKHVKTVMNKKYAVYALYIPDEKA